QYQAEFGNATGVILNTVTRTGTNDLHGRAYYFHRDERLDARNAFQTTRATFEQKQPGGWLGGPIARDRTHYFVTYEATRRMQIATVTSPVAPGDVEQPSENNQFLAKLTHQLNASHRLTGRFNVGVDFNRVTLTGSVLQNIPGVFQFSTDRPFNAADPTTYPTTFIGNAGDTNFAMVTTGVSAFSQDAWRPHPHVTLNVGVRYDGW